MEKLLIETGISEDPEAEQHFARYSIHVFKDFLWSNMSLIV